MRDGTDIAVAAPFPQDFSTINLLHNTFFPIRDVARQMRLYLIRHGETVDNVAGLYAGSLDSQLTNHGVQQTLRLGQYFAQRNVKITHLFASPLSRAFRTAEAIRNAQLRDSVRTQSSGGLEVKKVKEIAERDFGYYEGKPFAAHRQDNSKQNKHKSEPGFKDIESEVALHERVDKFLNERLLPLLDNDSTKDELVVVVVAHGMLLSHLWRRLLLRLPRKSLTIEPEVLAARGGVDLNHLGGWSNTGYMELTIRKEQESTPDTSEYPVVPEQDIKADDTATATATLPTPVPPPLQYEENEVSVASAQKLEDAQSKKMSTRTLSGYSTVILAIDKKDHLVGLKRQRGGIGSLAHDEGQKKLDSFFKKPKLNKD